MAATNAATSAARAKANHPSLIRNDCAVSMILAIGLAARFGILFAQILPRGPTTQLQGLLLLTAGLILGVLGPKNDRFINISKRDSSNGKHRYIPLECRIGHQTRQFSKNAHSVGRGWLDKSALKTSRLT
jgi:hypothetical protein